MEAEFSFNKFITKGIKIEKDDDEKRTFSGHISAEIVDKQNEFIAQNEIVKSMDSWLNCGAPLSDAHSNRIVGKGTSYEKSEYEGTPTVKIHGEIYKEYTLHDEVWKELQSGDRQGLSIGGSSKTGRQPIVKDGRTAFELKDLEIYEVAVCKSPANSLAIIDNVNEFAKSYDLTSRLAGDRNIIQCDSIDCIIKTNQTEEVGKAIDTISKFFNIGGVTAASNENLASQDPPNTAKPPKKTTKYINNKTVKSDMTEVETVIKEDKMEDKKVEEKKADDKKESPDVIKTSDVISLLTQSITKQNEIIEKQGETLSTLTETIEGLKKSNVAGEGATDDKAPPAAKGKDVGLKSKLETEYQGGSDQSGINKPDESPAVADKVRMTKEEEEDKKEDKKEDKPKEMEKSLQNPTSEDKNPNEIVKMDNGYEYVKTSTPRVSTEQFDYSKSMTGYDIIKAVESGWNGKYEDYTQSMTEMYRLSNQGAFGSGEPTGALN